MTTENEEGMVGVQFSNVRGGVGGPGGEQASEGAPICLDLYSCPPTQVAVLSSRVDTINPINTLTNAKTIEFAITSSGDELIFPQETRIELGVKLLTDGGVPIPNMLGAHNQNPAAKVLPANGISSNLFKNCKVKLNDTILEHGDGLYAYRADLENLLMTSQDEKNKDLEIEGHFNDLNYFYPWLHHAEMAAAGGVPANPYANFHDSNFTHQNFNDPYHKRAVISRNSQTIHVEGKIHSEIFEQGKVLPPSSKLYVSFDRQDFDSFSVLCAENQVQNYKMDIVSCRLRVTWLKIDPGILNEMIQSGLGGGSYILPVRRVKMDYITKQRTSDFSESNLFSEGNALPRKIFLAFVSNAAFRGDKTMDPFHYQNLGGIRTLGLRIGGEHRPYPMIMLDTDSKTGNNVLLHQLLDSTKSYLKEGTVNGLDLRTFNRDKTILGFDLSTVKAPLGENYEMPVKKSCDLEMTVNDDAEREPMTMVIYAEYDAEVEIDAYHNVKKKNFGTAE